LNSNGSNIVLIGFMGSGKSTIGRILARETETFLLDTDQLIEKREGCGIAAMFEEKGEAYFRKLEQNCLEWIGRSVKNSVIATGGGFPVHTQGIRTLGKVVLLDCRFETLCKRIGQDADNKRPLAEKIDHAENIYTSRQAEYNRLADLIIDAEGTPDATAAKILEALFPDRTR
jgi:shikimate kinase